MYRKRRKVKRGSQAVTMGPKRDPLVIYTKREIACVQLRLEQYRRLAAQVLWIQRHAHERSAEACLRALERIQEQLGQIG
jgi:hypothetical protein